MNELLAHWGDEVATCQLILSRHLSLLGAAHTPALEAIASPQDISKMNYFAEKEKSMNPYAFKIHYVERAF